MPGFVARGNGTIINIASSVALTPELLNGTYSGTKAYVVNFTQALHHELGAKHSTGVAHIDASCLHPNQNYRVGADTAGLRRSFFARRA